MKLDKIDKSFLYVPFILTSLISVLVRITDIFPNNKPANLILLLKLLIIIIPISLIVSFLSLAYKKLVTKHVKALRDIYTLKIALNSLIINLKKEITDSHGHLKNEISQSSRELCNEINLVNNKLDLGIQKIIDNNKDSLNHFFTNNPFGYFAKTNNHTGVIGSLIEESLKTGFSKLRGIDGERYLKLIQEAIKNTNSFAGVNKKSIRWFLDGDFGIIGGVPKDDVVQFNKFFMDNKKSIFPKRRIFVVSESSGEFQKMEDDLKKNDLLVEFEKVSTGIQTFWIKEEDLISYINRNDKHKLNKDTIYDFGVYDNLIIKYSYPHKELDYKEITKDDDEYKIYSCFSGHFQIYTNFTPFKPIFIFDNEQCIFNINNGISADEFYKSPDWKKKLEDKSFRDSFVNHIL